MHACGLLYAHACAASCTAHHRIKTGMVLSLPGTAAGTAIMSMSPVSTSNPLDLGCTSPYLLFKLPSATAGLHSDDGEGGSQAAAGAAEGGTQRSKRAAAGVKETQPESTLEEAENLREARSVSTFETDPLFRRTTKLFDENCPSGGCSLVSNDFSIEHHGHDVELAAPCLAMPCQNVATSPS